MLSKLLTLIQLKKELPDAIGYDLFGPLSFPVPEELSSELSESLKSITILTLRIDNFSSKVQKNVKILFSGSFKYNPSLNFQRRDITVKYNIDNENKELIITEIPPNETIIVEFFNPTSAFEIEQLLVGENTITKLMQQLTEAKRYPSLTRLKFFISIMMIILVIPTAWLFYKIESRNQNNQIITNAFERVASCTPYVFDNPLENEKLLERKFKKLGKYWGNFVLSANKVTTFDELKIKDQVILCKPNQP